MRRKETETSNDRGFRRGQKKWQRGGTPERSDAVPGDPFKMGFNGSPKDAEMVGRESLWGGCRFEGKGVLFV